MGDQTGQSWHWTEGKFICDLYFYLEKDYIYILRAETPIIQFEISITASPIGINMNVKL